MKTINYIFFILIIFVSSESDMTCNDISIHETRNKELSRCQRNNIKKFSNISYEEDKNTSFSGLWVNEDEQTRSITKCKIRYENNQFIVHMWGACHPKDCDWGELSSDQVKKDVEKFKLLWDHKFGESDITYEIIEGKLKLTSRSHFKDNSGRPDFTQVDYLIIQ